MEYAKDIILDLKEGQAVNKEKKLERKTAKERLDKRSIKKSRRA